MRPALTTIARILESSGMSRNETDQLLAMFLQEEAFAYVEYMEETMKLIDSEKEESTMIS